MKNLSVKNRLLFMLIPPVLALLFFAGNSVLDRKAVVDEMEELNHLTEVAVAASELVHELQKERGMTAGYLAGEGTEYASELAGQRAATDRVIEPFQEHIHHLDMSEQPATFRNSYARISEMLGGLSNRRDLVRGRGVAAQEAVDFYSTLNQELITMVSAISGTLTNAELTNRFAALVALMLEKEYAGLERAYLNQAFIADRFTSEAHFQDFSAAVARQEAYRSLFEMLGRGGDLGKGGAEETGASKEVRRLRQQAFDQAVIGGFAVDPTVWFRVATGHIDGLYDEEVRLVEGITHRAEELRVGSRNMLIFFGSITLIALLVALGVAHLIGRTVSFSLAEISKTADEIAQQLVATATQQSVSASETASSVSQTSTSIDELRQTSKIALDRSNAVRDKSERSVAASDEALKAIHRGVDAMARIRQEVEGIARNILELSEKNIQIGEIVQSVNAIAEQSNLLAVNASIEAAQAGEHGKGFAVVAGEVKALAGQSKEATAQIRAILSEIQKSSNAAVMVTEQGTKRVEESGGLIESLGQVIRDLSASIEESMDAAMQIAVTANQQLTGIEEITLAITNIEQATRENAAGTAQLEQAAQEVMAMSAELARIVQGGDKGKSAA